ncbi:uncharacterized protein AMSG_11591 [Thecamonas trahens ATCC 50062]|uniref:PPM-type phosphatase domain-containing protein n=1 Tax=Thecamonas trahens ATCC 50062 TaxID=461836 RepID=A0A0L0D3R9_THETB|nr:hypothetical protein AMSG_11591 [Thecamonas trahens ATCC 50062]KNC45948.1 hypothetical protein AMSG_11591 [Thecamonas trahens ATCC 50062]|eukprot:XP_013763189.1 hypothetical protein AMSG_11591 [Thecamonas trahens ATCC 50062]
MPGVALAPRWDSGVSSTGGSSPESGESRSATTGSTCSSSVSSEGTYLRRPVTKKHLESGSTRELEWVTAWMQGWRSHQEDAHTVEVDLFNTPHDPVKMFAVYDGHGGDQVSQLCADELPDRIRAAAHGRSKTSLKSAISRAVISLDEDLISRSFAHIRSRSPGSTAVIALVTSDMLLVGNVGDSRALACRRGKLVALTRDHLVNLPGEMARIQRAGGSVESDSGDYRVGGLAMSRAIGDITIKDKPGLPRKDQPVIADPEFTAIPFVPALDFLVVACDGIFEKLNNAQVIKHVKRGLAKGLALPVIASSLLDRCLASRNSATSLGRDNMSLIIVQFKHPLPSTTTGGTVFTRSRSRSISDSP